MKSRIMPCAPVGISDISQPDNQTDTFITHLYAFLFPLPLREGFSESFPSLLFG